MTTPTPEEKTDIQAGLYKEFCKDRDIDVIADQIEKLRKYYGLNLNDLSPAQQDVHRETLSDFDPTGELDDAFHDIRNSI